MDKFKSFRHIFLTSILCLTTSIQAEVTVASDTGFVSVHELEIAATPRQTYQALTREIHRWWDAVHSYSGQAENFSLDDRAGGCFCEKLENGGSVEHMHVVFADPGKMLRLTGGLGPLQQMSVQGVMTFSLSPTDTGHTLLHYSYAVGGYTEQGLSSLAGPVDQVQLGQLMRLKGFLENSGD